MNEEIKIGGKRNSKMSRNVSRKPSTKIFLFKPKTSKNTINTITNVRPAINKEKQKE